MDEDQQTADTVKGSQPPLYKYSNILHCVVLNVKTHIIRKEPQIKFAFLWEQLPFAAAQCNKASAPVQQKKKTNSSPSPQDTYSDKF